MTVPRPVPHVRPPFLAELSAARTAGWMAAIREEPRSSCPYDRQTGLNAQRLADEWEGAWCQARRVPFVPRN
jgi:hypothetical protein